MKGTVVIIEDDKWTADHLRRLVRKEGYEAYTAPHAIAAIDLIDDTKPDVIFLDMLLSGSTALTLLHELQSHPDLATIPVVIVSNTADRMKLDDLSPYGVKSLLDKSTMRPGDVGRVLQRIAP